MRAVASALSALILSLASTASAQITKLGGALASWIEKRLGGSTS